MSQHISALDQSNGTTSTSGLETVSLCEVDLSDGEGGINIDDCVFAFEAEAVLKTASLGASLVVRRTFRRFGGNLVALGSTVTVVGLSGDAGLALAALNLDASGDSVRLRATGALGQNISWTHYLKMRTSEFGA